VTTELEDFEQGVESEVLNITDTAFTEIKDYFEDIFDDFESLDFDLPAFPTLHLDFTLDNITIPECEMRFQFDGLELFIATEIKLAVGSTYTLNLFSSESPLGVRVSENLQVGVIFAIDLILDVQAEIDITSGFHIKLDDGLLIDIKMFGQDVSDVTL
jgi:hypothetical protein